MGSLAAETVETGYDAINRPEFLGGNGAYVANAIYSGLGPMIQMTNGMVPTHTTWQTMEYDQGTARLARLRLDRNGYPNADYDLRYSYTPSGTITKIAAALPQSGGATDNQCFKYAALAAADPGVDTCVGGLCGGAVCCWGRGSGAVLAVVDVRQGVEPVVADGVQERR